MNVWDIGGQDKIRNLWKHYYVGADAIIFVVDSADRERVTLASKELEFILQDEDLKKSPLMVFANKQDLPDAMALSDLICQLKLDQIQERSWKICPCSATNSNGITQGAAILQALVK